MQTKTKTGEKKRSAKFNRLKVNKETVRELQAKEKKQIKGGGTFCLGCMNGGTGQLK